MAEQLLLFQDMKEEMMQREINKLREQCENVRKGIYAKHANLLKLYMEQREELDILKRAMCKVK